MQKNRVTHREVRDRFVLEGFLNVQVVITLTKPKVTFGEWGLQTASSPVMPCGPPKYTYRFILCAKQWMKIKQL